MNDSAAATSAVPFDEAEFLAAAEAATGLSDWGRDQSFRVGLGKLIASINEMNFPAVFLHQARERMLGILVTKLHLIEDGKQHPEILAEKIERPVIIVGLPRTGTTVVYDLLALDPAARTPREWEYAMPWPAPEAASWDTDPRIAQLNAIFAQWLKESPKLADIQAFDATHPSECNFCFTHHFASTQFPAEWGVPSYGNWLRHAKVEGRYASHKRILQELQWKGPRGRWTLKSPEHLSTLEELIEAYPDACLIWTHRDPPMALSSLSSMITELRNAVGLPPDPHANGRYVVDTWATAIERATEVRNRNSKVEQRIIDIAHRDVIADKPAVMRRIYEHFKLPFTPGHDQRIEEAVSGTVSARLGRHKHQPADFGIDSDELRTRIPTYLKRFGNLF